MTGDQRPRKAILALNAGSSSVKFGLYATADSQLTLVAKGEIERLDEEPHLTVRNASGAMLADRRWSAPAPNRDDLLSDFLLWIEAELGGYALTAVGHRIVHGGSNFVEPTALTSDIIEALRALTPLAPLHQPLGLVPVDAIGRLRPNLLQVACFDTAFHHTLQPPVSRYAIPLKYEAKGIRQYGFHGLSFEFVARRLGEISPHLLAKRTVVAHLGNGASLCAMRHGKSVDTTMGFSTLDGLVMGTRSGSIDPGILLFLLQEEKLTPAALEELLYHKSGLLGVSGISGDMRTLLASDDHRANEAVDLFVFRIARETASMANTLGGIEAFIFTGGIGENSAPIRAMVAERLAWLGIKIDRSANEAGAERIDEPQSGLEVRVIPTDEEVTIARQVQALIQEMNARS